MTALDDLVGMKVVRVQRGIKTYSEEVVLCGEDGRCFRLFARYYYEDIEIKTEEVEKDDLWEPAEVT